VTYRWVDHTSELELEIETATEPGVFVEALRALAELVGDDRGLDAEQRSVLVRGKDRASLLAAWLDELVFLAETQGFMSEQVSELDLDQASLTAAVRGHVGEPRHLVKAVTMHRLLFAADGDHWRARVVLDV
jgi:SHS2 domain-containing protein